MADPRFFANHGPFTIAEILEKIPGLELAEAQGIKCDPLLQDVAPLDIATSGELSFLSNKKYRTQFQKTTASACVVHPDEVQYAPKDLVLFVSTNPYADFALIAALFYPEKNDLSELSLHESAHIDPTATLDDGVVIGPAAVIGRDVRIGKNTKIEAHAVIGNGVVIGSNCVIGPKVVLSHAIIGSRVVIHPGVSIGQDGFGYALYQGKHLKVPQLGRVLIGNDVEIGANTTIDRGAGPDTIIGDGCKIDNLVQIGHNVHMGKACIIVSEVGISGSTKLGDYVVVGGQAGIAGHLTIGNAAQIAAGSGVIKDVEPQGVVGGYPAQPIKDWHRQSLHLKKMMKKQ